MIQMLLQSLSFIVLCPVHLLFSLRNNVFPFPISFPVSYPIDLTALTLPWGKMIKKLICIL